VRASTPVPDYGGRFFDELQRLTKSTSGFTYAELSRVRVMDREQLLAVLSKRYELDSLLQLDSSSPEALARAMVREGVGYPANPAAAAYILSTLLDLIRPF
jgi:hypothetical protein